jgi:ribosomal protein L31
MVLIRSAGSRAGSAISKNLMVWPVVGFIGFVSFVGFYFSVKFGLASLHFYSVDNMLDNWNKEWTIGQQESTNKIAMQIDSAMNKTIRAHQLHSSHPVYTDILGQLNEWDAISAESALQHDKLQSAKRHYMKAIAQRPTWPVTHASLLVVKWRLGEFDEEMITAINAAKRNGPKKPEVHLALIQFGLASYKTNHPFYAEVRDILPQYIGLALSNMDTYQRVLNLIAYYDARLDVCRWMRKASAVDAIKMIKCGA